QTLGVLAYADGSIIVLRNVRLGVVDACSGLSMLLTFFALATAVALLSRRPGLDRLGIVLGAIPIAVACTVIRITATGVLHSVAGPRLAELVFHDLAGWLMMPLALGFLWLVVKGFAWMFPEVSHGAGQAPRLVLPSLAWKAAGP